MNFPIAPFQRLFTEVFGRMPGTLDAHLRASGRPDAGIAGWAVRGEAHVRDASLLPLVLGREINRLEVRATTDGTRVVPVSQFSGEMGSGGFTGERNLVRRENTIDRAHAELHVARRRSLPRTMQ